MRRVIGETLCCNAIGLITSSGGSPQIMAERGAHAIHELTRQTQLTGDDLAYPADTAAIIATLAAMTGMLGQLLAQLTRRLAHQHQNSRLTLDSIAPQPDLAQAMHALTSSLYHAIEHARHTAAELDTAHQHAAHLAAAEPATNNRGPNTNARGQNSCRSVRRNHLTKHSHCFAVSRRQVRALGRACKAL